MPTEHQVAARARRVLIAVSATLALYPSMALASWSRPHTLSPSTLMGGPSGKVSQACDLAVRSNGSVVATWTRRSGEGLRSRRLAPPQRTAAFVAEKRPGGAWGRARTVWAHTVGIRGSIVSNGIYATCPKIVLGAQGTLDTVWSEQREVGTAQKFIRDEPPNLFKMSRDRSGRWSRRQLWARNATRPLVLSNDHGAAIVYYRRGRAPTTVSRAAGKSWGKPQSFTRNGIDSFRYGNLDLHWILDSADRALVVWTNSSRRLVLRTWANGRWADPQAVPKSPSGCGPGPNAVGQREAIAPDGTVAIAVNCEYNAAYNNRMDRGRIGLQIALRRPSGEWVFPGDLDVQETTAYDATAANQQLTVNGLLAPTSLGYDAAGNLHVTWQRKLWPIGAPDPEKAEIRSTVLPAGAAATLPATTIATLPASADGGTGDGEMLASIVQADGSSAAALVGPAGAAVITRAGVFGPWSAPMISGPLGGTCCAADPRRALLRGGGGNAALLWTSNSAQGVRVSTTKLGP